MTSGASPARRTTQRSGSLLSARRANTMPAASSCRAKSLSAPPARAAKASAALNVFHSASSPGQERFRRLPLSWLLAIDLGDWPQASSCDTQ